MLAIGSMEVYGLHAEQIALFFKEMTNMYPACTQSRPLSCRCLDSYR